MIEYASVIPALGEIYNLHKVFMKNNKAI